MNNAETNPNQDPLYREPLRLGGIEIAPVDLLEHVLATGGTGSGKTRSFLLPLVEAVLKRFGIDPETKAGMILLDAKGDMTALASKCVERSGRSSDLYILGPGGNCWFALFAQFQGDATLVGNFLFECLQDRSGFGAVNEAYWDENARRLLRAATISAKAVHGSEFGGLEGIADGLNLVIRTGSNNDDDDDDGTPKEKLIETLDDGYIAGNISANERHQLISYVENDVIGGNPRTWSTIANYARNFLAQFSLPALQDLFRPAPGKRRLVPEDVIDEGLCLVVSLSPVVFGDAASPFRVAIKKAFCQRILQRKHLVHTGPGGERQINQCRPLLFVMDECHTVLTPTGNSSDVYFLDRAREFRCMCMLATQGISAIRSVIHSEAMLNHLLNNLRTKFFFASDCPETAEYFEFAGGKDLQPATSMHFEVREQPPRFRLPNHTFVPAPKHVAVGHTRALQKDLRFSAAQLGSIPTGTALVILKGRRLVTYRMDPAAYC